MRYSTLDQDWRSGLVLLRDSGDPPRYYIRQGRRLELIAIGNEGAARSRFAVRCSRARRWRAALGQPRAAGMELYRQKAGGLVHSTPRDGPEPGLQVVK